MMKKWLSLVCLMAGVVGMAHAQEATREASPLSRTILTVTSAELTSDGKSPHLIVKGKRPDSCDLPVVTHTERIGKTWFVDLYHERPFNTECLTTTDPYEADIDAAEALDPKDPASLIVINDKIFGVEMTDPTAAPTLSDTWSRGPLPYDHIIIRHTQQADMSITLSGTLSDSCPIPVYRAVPDWQNPGFTTIEAYTAINIAAMCAQSLVPFEVTFNTPVFDSIAINGVSVPFNPAMNKDTQEFVEQAMNISSATTEWVEGLQPNLKITVKGTTDGCEAPIQMVPQLPVDNTYVIKVVRVMPADTICTMIARDFTEELMFTPNMAAEQPLTLYIGDKTLTVPLK